MTVIYPHNITYPRDIAVHDIAAGDVLRVSWRPADTGPVRIDTGIVAGVPGEQFRKRWDVYWIDLQYKVGGKPILIHTEAIARVELVAPAPDSPVSA